MDNCIQTMKTHLKEKEETIDELVTDYKSVIETISVLQSEVRGLSDDCALKQNQHGVIDDLVKKECQELYSIIERHQNSTCERSINRLEVTAALLNKSLGKLTVVEEIAPMAFDDRNLKDILNGMMETLVILDRQTHEKRSLVQQVSREKIFLHHDLKEDTQLLNDILFEFSELKKEEEEREANGYQKVITMMKNNGVFSKKLNAKAAYKNN